MGVLAATVLPSSLIKSSGRSEEQTIAKPIIVLIILIAWRDTRGACLASSQHFSKKGEQPRAPKADSYSKRDVSSFSLRELSPLSSMIASTRLSTCFQAHR